MTKARRMIEDSLKQVDMAVEILDARIPLSSHGKRRCRLRLSYWELIPSHRHK